ncbi:unnamed protein product [Brachionus calyciflorus]|uniref:Transglutaminase-like domain-containing protein n=1 Tax=Brachionus calyciflorus TaxID=104777 RepID=A0A813M3E7_9BILA|nr:unnamed protein product [Brachionus calyciflorus]
MGCGCSKQIAPEPTPQVIDFSQNEKDKKLDKEHDDKTREIENETREKELDLEFKRREEAKRQLDEFEKEKRAQEEEEEIKRKKIEYELNLKELEEQAEINNWVTLIQGLLSKTKLNNHINAKSRKNFNSLEQLANYLKNSPAENDLELYWVVFVWIAENITYNMTGYLSGNLGDNEANNVFNTGLAVCQGYANLYSTLCEMMGLECRTISGFAKGIGYKVGDTFNSTNHAWNAIKINEKWFYVDSTWAGRRKNNSNEVTDLMPYWFLTPPNIFLESHYSPEMKLHRKCTQKEFENLKMYGLEYYVLGFKSFISTNSIIKCDSNPFFMELKSNIDCDLSFSLYEQSTDKKIENSVILQKDTSLNLVKYGIIVFLEMQDKNYILKIFGKKFDSDKKTSSFLTEFILRREGDKINNEIPKYDNITFHNGQIKLVSPKSTYIVNDSNPLFIELQSHLDFDFSFNLKEESTDKKIENSVILQKDTSLNLIKYGVIVFLEKQNKNYSLEIFGKKFDSEEKTFPYLTQLILKRNSDRINNEISTFDNISFLDGQVKLLSHKSMFITYDSSPLILEFSVPFDADMMAKLKYLNGEEIKNSTLVQKNPQNSNILVYVVCPLAKQRFILTLLSKNLKDNMFYGFADFQIFCKSDRKENLESKFVTKYSSEYPFFIHSPTNRILKLNEKYKFKFYIEKAIVVMLWDQNKKQIYIDKSEDEENIYEIEYAPEILGELKVYVKYNYGSNLSGLCLYEVQN